MIWSVPEQIAYLSEYYTLEPGDLIYSGTPAGVGPVKPGDELHAGIDGVGELKVKIVAGAVKLYTYFRSSAAFRVRIALNLKGLAYEPRVRPPAARASIASPSIGAVNPQALVPALELDDGRRLCAVARDHRVPRRDASAAAAAAQGSARRARACARFRCSSPARSIRSTTCARCSTCSEQLGQNEEQVNAWYRHWIADGLRQARSGARWRRRRPAGSATATRRPWPTAASCRRSSTRSATSATLAAIPRRCACSTNA